MPCLVDCRSVLALAVLVWVPTVVIAQAPPVCPELRYGTAAEQRAIERTMQDGGVEAVVATLRAAQRSRGQQLGCAESSYAYAQLDPRAPSADAVARAWSIHRQSSAAALAQYDACPALGRGAGAYALGGWIARSIDESEFDVTVVERISENFTQTQFLYSRAPGQATSWPGMYGYAESLGDPNNTCFVAGVVGSSVAQVCSTVPEMCVNYTEGRFAGQRFGVSDYRAADGLRDGGGGFDQGWAGLMMVEAALGARTAEQRARFADSALAAGDFAINTPPVRNHNYTAKLIGLLAVLYDWTGEARFRQALIDKLERNLLPGVLMDADADGQVDGVPGVRFDQLLAPAARTPGRMWDAHNALPWYHAMNAAAAVEAYAAFSARGDSAMKTRLRRYAEAMLDNLAGELAAQGGLDVNGPGATQVSYALAIGLWKLADPEGLSKPAWEAMLNGFWNAGLAQSPGDIKTATAAVVYARSKGHTHIGYGQRASALAAQPPLGDRVAGVWWNPARSGEGILVNQLASNRLAVAWFTYAADQSGRQLWLFSDGGYDGVSRFSGSAVRTQGGRFGDQFDAALVERLPWGALQIEFSSCNQARLSWQSSDPAYADGLIELQRLGDSGGGC